MYDGQFSSGGLEKAAGWLGSSGTIKYAEDFVDATNWTNISTPWQLGKWKGTPYTMVWGVPMLPCGGSSTQCQTNEADYNEVASGGADGYYKTLAQNLVANGFGSSYVRVGWEFNGSAMGWSICNQKGSGATSWAKDFVPGYRNVVTSMRSVKGANFKFVWNPLDSSNVSCPGVNLEDYYPGDSYVDAVGLDVYDGVGQTVSTNSARWSDLVNGVNGGHWTAVTPESINGQKFEGYGLTWIEAFGKEHDKQVAIPEWGLDETSTNGGGGDDAYFVTQMANWIKASATGPAIFWNYANGNLPLDIPSYTSANTPAATAAFKAAFGAGS
ncbi:MAG TPA: glycosyl hydrolase [Trebonia sp.]